MRSCAASCKRCTTSVTRYTSPGGAKQGRILQGLKKDWIHGNVQMMTGCASYGNGWYAKHKCENSHTTDWVITIGQNNVIGGRSIVRCNGIDGSMRNHHGGEGDVDLVINKGECPKENSDWAVAELMTWDRHFTRAEIEGVEAYLACLDHAVLAQLRGHASYDGSAQLVGTLISHPANANVRTGRD